MKYVEEDQYDPIDNSLDRADKVHPNVLGHRKRLAQTIDNEEWNTRNLRDIDRTYCLDSEQGNI